MNNIEFPKTEEQVNYERDCTEVLQILSQLTAKERAFVMELIETAVNTLIDRL